MINFDNIAKENTKVHRQNSPEFSQPDIHRIKYCSSFITKFYFPFPKKTYVESTHCFIMNIPNKRETQQIAINYSSGVDSNDFVKLYGKCIKEPYSLLVNDTSLPSDNQLRFRKNLMEKIVLLQI